MAGKKDFVSSEIAKLTPALAREGTSVALARKIDLAHTEKAIASLIARAANITNVGKNLNSDQVVHAAISIALKYWFMKVDEVALALERGLSGEYGKTYDVFDFTVICLWLDSYWDSQVKEREKEAAELKSKPVQTGLPEEVSDFLTKTFLSKMDQEQEEKKRKEAEYRKFRQQFYEEQAKKKAEEALEQAAADAKKESEKKNKVCNNQLQVPVVTLTFVNSRKK